MPVLKPRVFVSYSRRDAGVVQTIVDALRGAGIECWLDTLRLQVGEDWNRVIAQEINESDVFLAYLTFNYEQSAECQKELEVAMKSPRILVLPYADSIETRDGLREELKGRINCGVLGPADSDQHRKAILELVGRAWAALQVVERVAPSRDHILASPSILDTVGYTRDDILARTSSELVLAGANLRSWLSDDATQDGLLNLVRAGKRVRLILGTHESLRGISEEGAQHLDQSVDDILKMRAKLNDEQRRRFIDYFHVGAATLSAVFVDPNSPSGFLFFSPRWAIQFLPQDRFSCVIDKRINGDDLYKSLYNGVFLMTQADAKTAEAMAAERRARNTLSDRNGADGAGRRLS